MWELGPRCHESPGLWLPPCAGVVWTPSLATPLNTPVYFFWWGWWLLPWTRWCSEALSLRALGQLVPALWRDVGNGVPIESVVCWLSPSKDSLLPPVHTLSPLPPWMLLPLPGMWVIVGFGVRGLMFWCACWPIPLVAWGGLDLLNVEEGSARCRVVLWRLFLICTRVAVSGGVDCLLSLVFWDSHPLTVGTPSVASLLLLGWTRGCHQDVWPQVISTLGSWGWLWLLS